MSLVVCDVLVTYSPVKACVLDVEGKVDVDEDGDDVRVTIEVVKEGVGLVFETVSGVFHGERKMERSAICVKTDCDPSVMFTPALSHSSKKLAPPS